MLRLFLVALASLTLASCGVPRAGLGADGSTGCMRNSDCEDSFRCTADQCQDGLCRTEVRDDLCADGPGGICAPMDPDANTEGCVYRACDEATCMETQRDPTICEVGACEGDLCVGESTCAPGEVCCGDGTCMDCDDGNPCTDDVCMGGACQHPPLEGVLCNDSNPCTVNDICTADGSCGGTTCEEIGATLMCDPGRGCVGCLADADCPDSNTPWSPCSYGGPLGDPSTCSGTQSRNVTTGTCVSDMCNFNETTETRNCDRGAGSNVRCDSDSVTAYGACNYTDVCDQRAQQERTRTIWRCDAATCASQMMTERRDCNRTTNGDSCGADILGSWSSCGYDNNCDETGERSRSITEQICGGGSCGTRSGGTETEVGPCTRSRDGNACGAGLMDCTAYGACMGFSNTCDETGTEERTCTDSTCGSDMCNTSAPFTDSRACMRDTDGDSCGTPSAWGSCTRAAMTDCAGQESRTVPECTTGSCGNRTEMRACNVSNGTSCGTATTGDWGMCVQSAPTSCTGEETRTLTNPQCNGSGTCDPNMTTEMRACDLTSGTTCGTPITGRLADCQRTGNNCSGMQDIEDVTYTCDGAGGCDENVMMTGSQACDMPAGTSCGGGDVCDGSGGCD